jgi:replicative DNA helicase
MTAPEGPEPRSNPAGTGSGRRPHPHPTDPTMQARLHAQHGLRGPDFNDDERRAALDAGEPLDDDVGMGERIPFPVDALPAWCAQFVTDTAESTQTPTDLGAALALAVLTSGVMGRFTVQARPGWTEPAVLYVVGLAESGERKSSLVRPYTDPVRRAEREHEEATADARAAEQAERKVLEKRQAKMLNAASKPDGGGHDPNELAQITRKLAESLTLPPCFVLGNFTDEALGVAMKHHGRIAVFSAEPGPVFDNLRGRYAKNGAPPSMDALLAGHAGDSYEVHRIGREAVRVSEALVTIGVLGQPSVLRGLATNEAASGRGALARFLVTFPPSRVGHRRIEPRPVGEGVPRAYADGVRSLYRARSEAGERKVLPFGSDAWDQLRLWAQDAERDLLPDGSMSSFVSWGSKLPGAVVRMAGVLAVADDPDLPPEHVGAEHVARAIRIAEHFRSEMPRVLALMAQDQADGTPGGLADKLEHALKAAGRRGMSLTDAHRATKNHVEGAALRAAFAVLVKQTRARRTGEARRGARWFAT